jgi:hypothetical protein
MGGGLVRTRQAGQASRWEGDSLEQDKLGRQADGRGTENKEREE